jgi:hypothetical protein
LNELETTYRSARYIVHDGDLSFTITVGAENTGLQRFLLGNGISEWAFMTAYNPLSQPLPEAENKIRQEKLRSRLREAGYSFVEGYGTGDNWEPEASLFVLDIPRDAAVSIAREFGQHAILFGTATSPAELVWCIPIGVSSKA